MSRYFTAAVAALFLLLTDLPRIIQAAAILATLNGNSTTKRR